MSIEGIGKNIYGPQEGWKYKKYPSIDSLKLNNK
jgi:hypothetical protein